MTKAEMKGVADECEALFRSLANNQDDDVTLPPRKVQRLVNALVNAHNCFRDILAGKIDPSTGGFAETADGPGFAPPPA